MKTVFDIFTQEELQFQYCGPQNRPADVIERLMTGYKQSALEASEDENNASIAQNYAFIRNDFENCKKYFDLIVDEQIKSTLFEFLFENLGKYSLEEVKKIDEIFGFGQES